jgi:hypothetical protein
VVKHPWFLKVEVALALTSLQPFLKGGFGSYFVITFSEVLAPPFLKVEVALAPPFLKVDYHALPKAPPPNTEFAAIGSPNPSIGCAVGLAAPTNGVVSCLYMAL